MESGDGHGDIGDGATGAGGDIDAAMVCQRACGDREVMITQRQDGIGKRIWSEFLALYERLIGRPGMVPLLMAGGFYLGGIVRMGQYLVGVAICALIVACANYFILRIGKSDTRHAFNVALFVLFFGGFGFGIGYLSPF